MALFQMALRKQVSCSFLKHSLDLLVLLYQDKRTEASESTNFNIKKEKLFYAPFMKLLYNIMNTLISKLFLLFPFKYC